MTNITDIIRSKYVKKRLSLLSPSKIKIGNTIVSKVLQNEGIIGGVILSYKTNPGITAKQFADLANEMHHKIEAVKHELKSLKIEHDSGVLTINKSIKFTVSMTGDFTGLDAAITEQWRRGQKDAVVTVQLFGRCCDIEHNMNEKFENLDIKVTSDEPFVIRKNGNSKNSFIVESPAMDCMRGKVVIKRKA